MRPGVVFICIGIAFWIAETIYFGCNMWPESHAEVVCDSVSVFLMAYGLGRRKQFIIDEKNKPLDRPYSGSPVLRV